MKISRYGGLYVLTETRNGVTATIGSSWDRKDLEETRKELEGERWTRLSSRRMTSNAC